MKIYLTKLILFLLIFLPSSIFGQGGREFWFAAPEVTSRHADRPIVLRLSTFGEAAEVTISQPANPSFGVIRQSIPANTLISVDLSKQIDQIETKPSNLILKTGLLIQSNRDINAYYEVVGYSNRLTPDNAEIFTLKGNNALGTLFYVPIQTIYDNHTERQSEFDAWASFDIVATENNTTIKITPSKGIFGNLSGLPFTITLNKGQTYSCRAKSANRNDKASGSKIESDKPIAITYKDDSIQKFDAYDLIGDQILPVAEIGTEYIAVRNSGWLLFADKILTDDVVLVGTKNGTKVKLNNDSTFLNEGESKSFQFNKLDSCIYIKSTEPIYALHVSGFYNELACANLVPLKCTGSKSYQFLRTTDEDFVINLIVRSGGEANFRINGANLISPSSFREVPNTNGEWKYGRFNFKTNVIQVSENKPNFITNSTNDFNLCVLEGGFESSFKYGYFSGFANLNLGPDRLLCQKEELVLDAGINKDTYFWNNGETTQTIIIKDTGIFTATITKSTCEFNDTVKVSLLPLNTQKILGNDTSTCRNVPLTIQAKSKFRSYLWQDNSTLENFQPKSTGQYILEVSDSNGCTRKDSLLFTLFQLPTPKIEWDKNVEKFCNDSLFTFSLNNSFKSISWYNGEKSNSMTTSRNAKDIYYVSVKDDNGCSESDTLKIDCSPYITIPNVFTPNGDSYNETFKINNLKIDQWQLNVFGRYGTSVYKSESYNNDWTAENIPDGVYFYSLKNKETSKDYKGTVQILR